MIYVGINQVFYFFENYLNLFKYGIPRKSTLPESLSTDGAGDVGSTIETMDDFLR